MKVKELASALAHSDPEMEVVVVHKNRRTREIAGIDIGATVGNRALTIRDNSLEQRSLKQNPLWLKIMLLLD